jgi:glyoxylase-like metal-dependent hydrolase (beta-lactamase superfamily II)
MREILPGIFSWGVLSERHGYDFNGTFVRDPAGNLCIDPVEPGEEILSRLAREGVSRILLTNRNHTRAARQIRERTGAEIAIHPADAEYARGQGITIDGDLKPGQRLGAFTVIGCPGKSPGEIAFHDPERRLLIVGDALIGNPPGRLSLLPDQVMDDPELLRESVRVLLKLDFDAIVVGDGVSLFEDARGCLETLVASF